MPKEFKTVEHAGTGLTLPESTARRLDELSKGLPKDFTYRRMAKNGEMESVSDGDRTDVSYITTDDVDRDHEVVLPNGVDTSKYNRVCTFAHDYRALPAGSNWWIRPKMKGARSGLAAKTHYPPRPTDWEGPWLPSAVLHLMQQPVPTCTGKSIGFLPLNIRPATAEEKSRRPELKDVPIIDKCALLEYAVAPVPANAAAEMIAVSKGIESGAFDSRTADVLMRSLEAAVKAVDTQDETGGPETPQGTPGDMTASMPVCQSCMNNDGVYQKDDGSYMCSVCGGSVMGPTGLDEQDKPEQPAPAVETKKPPKSFVTAAAYREALQREVAAMSPQLKEAVKQGIIDAITLKRGR